MNDVNTKYIYCYYQDIKIICSNKSFIEINSYSKDLIKSSYNFNINELFNIKSTIIEGIFINYGTDQTTIERYSNCTRNGKYYYYNIGFYKNYADFGYE